MASLQISHDDLSQLIGLVYDSAFEETQWQSLLERLVKLFPGIGVMVMGHEGNLVRPRYVSAGRKAREFPDTTVEINFRNKYNNNAMSALLDSPNGYVARSRKMLDPDIYRKSDFFQNIMKPLGLYDYLNLKLDSNRDRGAFIAIGLPTDLPDLDHVHDQLFELLKVLAPHAVRALQLSRAMTLSRSFSNALGGFLNSIILPMIVANLDGKFIFANTAGQRLLDRGEPFHLNGAGQVVADGSTGPMSARFRDMAKTNTPSGLRVDGEADALSVCLVPFRPSMADFTAVDRDLLDQDRLFAIFVGQPRNEAISSTLLQDVFELTEREAEVCRAVISGQTPAEIAAVSGRSLKTIRNQIQVVHEKVGVGSTQALMDALSVFRTVGTMFEDEARAGVLDGADLPHPLT